MAKSKNPKSQSRVVLFAWVFSLLVLVVAMRAVEEWMESRDDEEIITDVGRLDKEPLRFETDALMDPPPAASNSGDDPLRLLVKVLYAMADVGLTGFSAIMGFYLNAFLLEVAGIAPEAVAFILLGAKLADAFADPFIGWASDKTRTRFGRRKVWIFIFFVPTVVMYVAVWFVPPFSTSGKIAYYALILIFYSMLVSCVNLPIHALAPELTSNYDERTSLMMYKVLFFSAMTIIATFVHSMVIGAFHYAPGSAINATGPACNISLVNGTLASEPVNAQLGYMVSGFIFAAVTIPPLILLLVCVPERALGKKKNPIRRDGSVRIKQFTVWESFVTMVTNRSFVCVTVIYLFSQLAIQFVQNNLILYIKYVLKREEWFSYILLLLLGTACVSLPVWELLSRKFGKSKMYFVGAIIGIGCFISAFFIDYYPSALAKDVVIWITAVVAGFAIGSLFLIPAAMLPDAITQDELTTGTRREGVFYAFFILFQKIALAVAVAISNFVLSSSGYISPESSQCPDPVQPEQTIFVLSLMIGVFPAAIMALSLIALAFYPVTKELHLDTLKKIEDEKKRNELITTDGEQPPVAHDF